MVSAFHSTCDSFTAQAAINNSATICEKIIIILAKRYSTKKIELKVLPAGHYMTDIATIPNNSNSFFITISKVFTKASLKTTLSGFGSRKTGVFS